MQFIDLKAQQKKIETEVNSAIAQVLEHGQFILGPEVKELEAKLSTFSGAKHTIACANGTDAMVIALRACDIGPGDAVFAPSFTFVATVEAIKLVGATPIFCDVDMETFNICAKSIQEAIDYCEDSLELSPKAIIAVDLFGQPADFDILMKIAEEKNLNLIADAAQSFGATQKGKKVGTLAHITTTSFFPAKPLGCYGDGGAIFTDNDQLAEVIRSVSNHGKGVDRYDNIRIGVNSRLDTIQAAILLAKLKIFNAEIIARDQVATRYRQGLSNNVVHQSLLEGTTSVWAQYTLVSDQRDDLRSFLATKDIPTVIYYPKPNHLQKPYINDPCAPNGLPNTEYLQERVFSLPMHPYLEPDIQDGIVSAIRDFYIE